MTNSEQFDTALPSPIARLAQLRARSSESVVRDDRPSQVQQLMAPAGRLEDAIWTRLGHQDPPRLLVLTGSAGSGKSATINHLLQRERASNAGRIGQHLADATHADSPDQEQADRLAKFLAPFADDASLPEGPCRVIAMNTGMALRFFNELRKQRAPTLSGLESLLRRRLGLPGATGEPPPWLAESVLVVNLDHRPTAGAPGDIFDEVLQRFDPGDPGGVLEGAVRCETCQVRDWCWPMANAAIMSSPAGRQALNAAVGDVALARGRQLAPRTLWDATAVLALSGLEPDQLAAGEDPCRAIAEVASKGDEGAVVRGLACNTALDSAKPGTLVSAIAERDPSYQPSRAAHELVSDAGLDPVLDGQRLAAWLSSDDNAHPAVRRAAEAMAADRLPSSDGPVLGRVLARAAWLAGDLESGTQVDPQFALALHAQGEGATAESHEALDEALVVMEEGLAEIFGLTSGPERYYPTSTPVPDSAADLLVEVRLVEQAWIKTQEDPVLAANPSGAELVGYRPVALAVECADRTVTVDHTLWRLLREATFGTAPSSVDLERFLALRQAIRRLGVTAGADDGRPLMVRERHAGGRKFRIVTRNARTGALRATEVF